MVFLSRGGPESGRKSGSFRAHGDRTRRHSNPVDRLPTTRSVRSARMTAGLHSGS